MVERWQGKVPAKQPFSSTDMKSLVSIRRALIPIFSKREKEQDKSRNARLYPLPQVPFLPVITGRLKRSARPKTAGSPFLCLLVYLAKQKQSRLPPGNPLQTGPSSANKHQG